MTMDSLDLPTMKNAVNCDNYCLLQTPKWTIKFLNAYCGFDLTQNRLCRRVFLSNEKKYIYKIIQLRKSCLKIDPIKELHPVYYNKVWIFLKN